MDEHERRELGLLALDAAVRGFGRGVEAVHVRSIVCTPDPRLVVDVRLRPSALHVEMTIHARQLDE
jgi:hypothetical protein